MVKITVKGTPATYNNHRWECEDKEIEGHLNSLVPEIVDIPELSPEKQEAHYEQVATMKAQMALVGVIVQQS